MKIPERISFDDTFPTKDQITKLYMNQMQLGMKINEVIDYIEATGITPPDSESTCGCGDIPLGTADGRIVGNTFHRKGKPCHQIEDAHGTDCQCIFCNKQAIVSTRDFKIGKSNK